jgi:hypothetical protein
MEIVLGGKQRKLKFGQFALQVFLQYTDFQTSQADLYACIYAGLSYTDYIARLGKDSDYTFEQVCEWCDEANQDELIDAYNEFTETRAFKEWYAKAKALIAEKVKQWATGEEKELIEEQFN